ncbi:MAG: SDR family NAD(P)-dependent oxidoreductase, partial [Bacteroidales bacterium]|nr:SDR family NAD(P)-dependent oxidoreductase [Bacteroidales bacterium]
MEKVQVVLVTGGSSGIGARTVKMLAEAGMKVYAASRRGTVCDQHKNIVPITMDVTITESVEHAIAEIVKQEGHLDAIVCNAGNGIAGAVESTTVDEGKYQFETC